MKINPFTQQKNTAKRIKAAIVEAEATIPGKGKGEDKRKQVIEFLVSTVDIPMLPKVAERILWNLLISLAVELMHEALPALVEAFRKKGKKDKDTEAEPAEPA